MSDATTARTLRPYMAHGGDAGECAVLAFAYTAKDARKLAFPVMQGFEDVQWIDMRAELLRDPDQHEYLMSLATSAEPHVIDNPPVCPRCERWGARVHESGNGCGLCRGSDEEEQQMAAALAGTGGASHG